jgi:hypothetical protein
MAKSSKNKTEENISLQDIIFSAKARRKLTAQFKDRVRQNILEGISKQGSKNPLLNQLLDLDKDRK